MPERGPEFWICLHGGDLGSVVGQVRAGVLERIRVDVDPIGAGEQGALATVLDHLRNAGEMNDPACELGMGGERDLHDAATPDARRHRELLGQAGQVVEVAVRVGHRRQFVPQVQPPSVREEWWSQIWPS